MSDKDFFTFRHTYVKHDETISADFWKKYDRLSKHPVRRLRNRRKTLTYREMATFFENIEEYDDSKPTFFLGLDAVNGKTGKKPTKVECSYLPLFIAPCYRPSSGLEPEAIYQETEKMIGKCSNADREVKTLAGTMALAEFIKAGQPVPCHLILDLCKYDETIKDIFVSELIMQLQEDHDKARFLDYLSDVYPLLDSIRGMKSFLETVISRESGFFLDLVGLKSNEELFTKMKPIVKPVMQFTDSWWNPQPLESRFNRDMEEYEYRRLVRDHYNRMGASESAYLFPLGCPLTGDAIIAERCISPGFHALIRKVHDYFQYCNIIYGFSCYPVGYPEDEGIARIFLKYFPAWVEGEDIGRKDPFDVDEWNRKLKNSFTILEAPADGSFPVVQYHGKYETYRTYLAENANFLSDINYLRYWKEAPDNIEALENREIYVGKLCKGRILYIRSAKEARQYIEEAKTLWNRLIDTADRIDFRNLFESMMAVSALWRVGVDFNGMLINGMLADELWRFLSLYPDQKVPRILLKAHVDEDAGRNWSDTDRELILDVCGFIIERGFRFKDLADVAVMAEDALLKAKGMQGLSVSWPVDLKGEVDKFLNDRFFSSMDPICRPGLLDKWSSYDLDECISVPDTCLAIRQHRIPQAEMNLSRSIPLLENAGSTTSKRRDTPVDWSNGLVAQSDLDFRIYAKWRKETLERDFIAVANHDWINALLSEVSHADLKDRGKLIRIMFELARFGESDARDFVFCYLLINNLPIPREMTALLDGNANALLQQLIIADMLGKGKLGFEELNVLSESSLTYKGLYSDAMQYVFPLVYKALYGNALRKGSESRKLKTYTIETRFPASSIGESTVTASVPVYQQGNKLKNRIISLWEHVHAVVYDMATGGCPHPYQGFTEVECQKVRETVWNDLFMDRKARRKFFKDWKMPEVCIWPFSLLDTEERNSKGVRHVYAPYFVDPNSSRYIHDYRTSFLMEAVEKKEYYKYLLEWMIDFDSGIARAVANASGEEEFYGELAIRMFGPYYKSAFMEKNFEIFQSAAAMAMHAYAMYRDDRKKSIYWDTRYRYGLLGNSDVYGWYLPFECRENEYIMKLIDNAARKVKGASTLKNYGFPSKVEKFISDKLDEWVKAGGRDPYIRNTIKISKTTLKELRKSSDEVREALKTEEDEEIIMPEPAVIEDNEEFIDSDFISMLTDVEKEVLEVILLGGNAECIAEKNFMTLDVVVDGINDKALDVFGETIIEESEIIPGYGYLADGLKAGKD